MQSDDRSYFLTRAEDELKLARQAADAAAARAHSILAGLYFERVYGKPAEAGGEQ